MNKLLVALGLIGFSAHCFAQHPTLNWVHNSSTTDQAHAYKSAISPDGGVVTVGDFRGSCNLDPAGSTAPHTSIGGFDGFVQALDSSGVFKWSYAFGSNATGGLEEQAMVVTIASSGDVYVAGRIRGTTVFQGSNPVTVNCAGGVDVVLLKLNSSGQLQWAFSIGGASNDMPTDIKVLSNGSVLLAGTFVNAVDFDPGSGTVTLNTGGTLEGFLANYDASGSLNWAVAAEGAGTVRYESLDEMSNGNIVIGGQYSGAVDFNFFGNNQSRTSSGGFGEAFSMCMTPQGSIQWLSSFTVTGGNSVAISVAVDRNDNTYVCGYFDDKITIGANSYTSLGHTDCFYAKLDQSGQVQWSQHGGTASGYDQSAKAIARPDSGVIFLSYANANFALQSGTFPGPSLGVFGGTFFMMLDDSGNFVWAEGVDEMSLNTTFTMNDDGVLYFTGSYVDGQDFDFGPANTNTSCSGSADMFIGRYKTPVSSSVSVGEISASYDLLIFPNPAADFFTIKGLMGKSIIQILDVHGKLIESKVGSEKTIEMYRNGWPAGMYFLKIKDENNTTIRKLYCQ